MEQGQTSVDVTPKPLATPARWALGSLLAFGALNAAGGAIFGLAGAKGIPIEWLSGSPFDDYFVPSVVLLLLVGGSLLWAALAVLRNSETARAAAFAAGIVLLAWIAIQIAIIGFVSWLQPATAAAAITVVALASTLPRKATGTLGTARAFAFYYAGTACCPAAAFDELRAEPRRLRLGAYAVLSNAALYTLVYVFLVMGHGRPTVFKPWLAIDPESYYRWDIFLLGPSVVVGWLLAGAVAQLVASRWGGGGTFEETLSTLGFAIAIASWCTLAHDLVTSGLGAFGVIDQRAYEDAMSAPTPFRTLIWTLMIAYLFAFIALFSTAVASTQNLRRSQAVVVGALAFIAYQGVFVLFDR